MIRINDLELKLGNTHTTMSSSESSITFEFRAFFADGFAASKVVSIADSFGDFGFYITFSSFFGEAASLDCDAGLPPKKVLISRGMATTCASSDESG
jgi:hypothetical protein